MNKVQTFISRGLAQEDILVRNAICLSAVVCLLWEWGVTFKDEYNYVWRGSTYRAKVPYLFARYSTLAIHIANVYVIFVPLSKVPVPRNECVRWFLMLTVGACILLACIDGLVMVRVHVLYNRTWTMGIFLASLLFSQGMLVASCLSRTLHLVSFSSTCDVLETPRDVVYIMAGVIITQVILLYLTIAGRKVAFGASPVVRIIVHDGAWAFVLIVSMWVTIIPYSLFNQVSKPHIIFVWPIVLMSIATCRLIMRLHKLPLEVLGVENGGTEAIETNILFENFQAAAGLGSLSTDSSSSSASITSESLQTETS